LRGRDVRTLAGENGMDGSSRKKKRVGSMTYPEVHKGLHKQLFDLMEMHGEDFRQTGVSHVIDAILAHFLTRGREEQKAVLAEGRRITAILEGHTKDGDPLMPGSYGGNPPPPSVKGRGGNPGHKAASIGGRAEVLEALRRRRDGKGD
jgi:hypothetical protein